MNSDAYTDNEAWRREIEAEENLVMARALLDRLGPSSRAVSAGSAAASHLAETGHRLVFGCCQNLDANAVKEA